MLLYLCTYSENGATYGSLVYADWTDSFASVQADWVN